MHAGRTPFVTAMYNQVPGISMEVARFTRRKSPLYSYPQQLLISFAAYTACPSPDHAMERQAPPPVSATITDFGWEHKQLKGMKLRNKSMMRVSSKEGGAGEASPPPPPQKKKTASPPPPPPQKNSSTPPQSDPTSPPPPPPSPDIANNYNYEVYPSLAVAIRPRNPSASPPKMKILMLMLRNILRQNS